jgi:hypothetical protein
MRRIYHSVCKFNKSRLTVAMALVLMSVVIGLLVSSPAHSQPAGPVGVFMRAKLEHSQKILEGLALRKHDQIAKGARELVALSNAAEWQVFDTEDFVQHSKEFRRSATALEKAAKEQNLDGAALAYMDVTLKCVNCHKYVRGVRMAGLDLKDATDRLFQSAPNGD